MDKNRLNGQKKKERKKEKRKKTRRKQKKEQKPTPFFPKSKICLALTIYVFEIMLPVICNFL